jgi:hypothetical protein
MAPGMATVVIRHCGQIATRGRRTDPCDVRPRLVRLFFGHFFQTFR